MYIIYDNITEQFLSSVCKNHSNFKWNGDLVTIDNDYKEFGSLIDNCHIFLHLKEARKVKKLLEQEYSDDGQEIDFKILRCKKPKTVTLYDVVEDVE